VAVLVNCHFFVLVANYENTIQGFNMVIVALLITTLIKSIYPATVGFLGVNMPFMPVYRGNLGEEELGKEVRPCHIP